MPARNGIASACISGASREQAQPLLAPLYYIERALQPFSEIAKSEDSNLVDRHRGLIKRNVSVLMLADIGTLPHDIKERVEEWVKKGGVLVRFAGPRLEKGGDDLLPVPLARSAGARWAARCPGRRRSRWRRSATTACSPA